MEYILTSRLLTDALESLFGKLKWMAGLNNGFGALSFKRVLRNYILGRMSCEEIGEWILNNNPGYIYKVEVWEDWENGAIIER